jgi:hypothetical protein
LEAFTDADYAGCLDTRLSRSGYFVRAYGGVVSWGSKKQSATSDSTTQAEFLAAVKAINEVTWLRMFLNELGVRVGRVPLYCDNKGALAHLKDVKVSGVNKHLQVAFKKCCEAVARYQVIPQFVGTADNTADVFTKNLPTVLFEKHRNALGVVSIPTSLLKGKC